MAFAWGILTGIAATLLLGGIGKAATKYAIENWFKQKT